MGAKRVAGTHSSPTHYLSLLRSLVSNLLSTNSKYGLPVGAFQAPCDS